MSMITCLKEAIKSDCQTFYRCIQKPTTDVSPASKFNPEELFPQLTAFSFWVKPFIKTGNELQASILKLDEFPQRELPPEFSGLNFVSATAAKVDCKVLSKQPHEFYRCVNAKMLVSRDFYEHINAHMFFLDQSYLRAQPAYLIRELAKRKKHVAEQLAVDLEHVDILKTVPGPGLRDVRQTAKWLIGQRGETVLASAELRLTRHVESSIRCGELSKQEMGNALGVNSKEVENLCAKGGDFKYLESLWDKILQGKNLGDPLRDKILAQQ